MKHIGLKTLTLGICLVLSGHVMAATDFNAIINENSRAQKDLYNQIRNQVEQTETVAKKMKASDAKESNEKYIVDNSETIQVPTRKEVLTFEKEKRYSRPVEKQTDKRVAQEMQDMD